MPKNGKAEVEEQNLDVEHELPAADETDSQQSASGKGAPESRVSEVEKLRAERDTLLDRLARMQAEFDNARKRSAKEQQDFRDYALVDTIKTLLPVLDSFERALQTKSEAGRKKAAPTRPLTSENLLLVCADPQLGFVISLRNVGFDPLRHEHAGAWKDWNLYDCRKVRSAVSAT